MMQPNDPKNKRTNKADEATTDEQVKTGVKKENTKEERDTVPVDPDAQNYFHAQDEDQELSNDDNRDIPL